MLIEFLLTVIMMLNRMELGCITGGDGRGAEKELWLLGREEEIRSPGWSVLAGQGVLGESSSYATLTGGRAADGRWR